MESSGTFIAYVAKNKEMLIHACDLVSFLLVTPEISKFMSSDLAKRWKYVDAFWLLLTPAVSIPASIYFFWKGETSLAWLFVGIVIFSAISVPGMLREHWELFSAESVPILRRSLRKTMFIVGFFLFGFSRAIGILVWAIETH
jgi:hypothetical protein